jgi:hypothetical protein
MTIRLIEGFDYYPSIAGIAGVNAAWTFDSTASVALIAGRFGGQAISGNAGSSVTRTLTRTVPATTTAAAGAALRINGVRLLLPVRLPLVRGHPVRRRRRHG